CSNAASVVTPGDTPGTESRMPLSAAGRTSLLPIQMLTNVGFASNARCTCVLPPRMNVVSGPPPPVPIGLAGSNEAAPGTATLFSTATPATCDRNEHVVDVPPPTRVPSGKLSIGGGQPGSARLATVKGVFICRASNTG